MVSVAATATLWMYLLLVYRYYHSCLLLKVTHSLTHSPTYSPTHSLTHSPTHSPTHPPTFLLTHPLTHSELLIREQEWDKHRVSVNEVYPAYLLFVSAAILVLTAAHLYRHEYISTSNLLSVIIVQVLTHSPTHSPTHLLTQSLTHSPTQSSKLLHLGGFPSIACASCASFLLNYTIPFAACFNSITDIITPGWGHSLTH
jgi:hypothetical protein